MTKTGAQLTIAADWRDAACLRLRIEDGGPGVADGDLPRLFDKFYRVRGPGEGSRRGLGIGLSVVRGMVEALGGKSTGRRATGGGRPVEAGRFAGGGRISRAAWG